MMFRSHEKRDIRQPESLPAAGCPLFFLSRPCALSRASGSLSFRYRVVEYYLVTEFAVHIHRFPRHHKPGTFLHLRGIEYHAGYEAVGETGATRVIPYREAVLVIRYEHVPVFRSVIVTGDSQPVAGSTPCLISCSGTCCRHGIP